MPLSAIHPGKLSRDQPFSLSGLILLVQAAQRNRHRVYPARKAFLPPSSVCLAVSFAWPWETWIPSPTLWSLSRSLTSHTGCKTPSRTTEALPLLVLPYYITHHKMGRSQFLGAAFFPKCDHSFCWEHQYLSVHIQWLTT